MIEKLVEAALLHRVRFMVILALLAVAGAFYSSFLRFDALPDVTGKQVAVITRAPGLTPEEVERLVTLPVEMAIAGVPGLESQRSISRYGLSSVTALFGTDVDLLNARQLLQERLNGVTSGLPPGVETPQLGPLTGGLGEIYQFTVSSPQRTTAQLLELVTYRVAPLLAQVPGVVEVNSWGGAQRTMDVVGDPPRMARRAVTLDMLHQAVTKAVGQVPGATMPKGDAAVLMRGVSWPRQASELASAVVMTEPDGNIVRVGDVAFVEEGTLPRIGAATSDGLGETVYVMVQMLLEDNALQVLEGVHAKMETVREALPSDVEISLVYDRSQLVSATLKTVFKNLLEGGVLVVLVLFLMLGSFRAGAIVASVIPLSMLGATAGMVFFGVPGNLMSLGALDFGLLVDGGVVMVEAIFHAVHDKKGQSMVDTVRHSTRAMARPVFYSVLMILLVYLPILSLGGVEGKMFRPMAITVVLALLTALLLSLTFVPAAANLLLREKDVPKKEPRLVQWANRAYAPILQFALKKPRIVLVTALLLLVVGVLSFLSSGTAFVPQLDEGDWVVQTTREADISVEAAVAQSLKLEAAVKKVPEVRHVSSRIGSPAVATDVMGLEMADVFIDLAPKDEWREGLSNEQLISDIEAAINESAPADELGFTQPIQMRFNELVGGAVTDVSVSFFGQDLNELQHVAHRAVKEIETISGAVDVRVLAPPEVSLLEVRPRPLESSRQNISPGDVLNHVQALKVGLEAGSTYDGPVRIPVRVRLLSNVNALTLEQVALPMSDGRLLPLSQVAQVLRRATPSMVSHDEAQRRVVVGFNVRERDLGSVVKEAEARVKTLSFPEGVRMEWGGQYEGLMSAQKRLSFVIPLVLLLIFGLLILLFKSLRPALLILLNVPFAAVGGMVFLYVRDMPVSISAAIGFIALSGIAVLNGVVLMNAILGFEKEGMSPAEAAKQAAQSRMRPVLMTAGVAALGFVPMMLAQGVGAEVQRPLATVVVGGLLTSTYLTLVILPALYAGRGVRHVTHV